MKLEEAIKRYTSNAFYEKSDGNLQGYLEFNQLAEWLKDYKRLMSALEDIKAEIETEKESMIQHNGTSDLGIALEIIDKHTGKENE